MLMISIRREAQIANRRNGKRRILAFFLSRGGFFGMLPRLAF